VSLLDDNRHSGVVYPDVVKPDVLGNPGKREPDFENGKSVHGRVQGNSSVELDANGQQLITRKTFRCRHFPAGAYSKMRLDGDPRLWDIVGDPIYHDGSDMTRHHTVSLVTAEPVPVPVEPAPAPVVGGP
jgi:hypothetical protein